MGAALIDSAALFELVVIADPTQSFNDGERVFLDDALDAISEALAAIHAADHDQYVELANGLNAWSPDLVDALEARVHRRSTNDRARAPRPAHQEEW